MVQLWSFSCSNIDACPTSWTSTSCPWCKAVSSCCAIAAHSIEKSWNPIILLTGLLVVEILPAKLNKKTLIFALISRRSRYRPGTRYFSRGIDANGHVSNFVETEQIVLYDGDAGNNTKGIDGKMQLSYVQTRGSIPIFWAQIINSKYTPKLWLGDSRKSVGINGIASIPWHFSYPSFPFCTLVGS